MHSQHSKPSAPTMWCKTCGYPLDGLGEPRCPECGRSFDPTNRRTFRRKPLLLRWQKIVRVAAVVLLLFLVQPLILYWRPLMEWRARKSLTENGNVVLSIGLWQPTPYHAWFVNWARRRKLPIPLTVGSFDGRRTATDAELIDASGLKNLTAFYLSRCRVTDEGLKHIKHLRNVQNLSVDNTNITDVGVAQITGFVKLKKLDLSKTRITDKSLVHIGGLTQLEGLDLSGTRVTDSGLAKLKNLSTLQTLRLEGVPITDKGVEHLKDLPGLQALCLTGTPITDNSIEHIAKLKNLELLEIRETGISRAGLDSLKKLGLRLVYKIPGVGPRLNIFF